MFDYEDLGRTVREKRVTKNLTQTELARNVSSTQPQVSLLEQGRHDAVSEATLAKIAKELGIDLNAFGDRGKTRYQCGICTNSECPGGVLGMVGTTIVLRPMMWRVHTTGASRPKCTLCGDIVIQKCEECQAPLKPGVFCSACGHRYVAPPPHLASLLPGERALQVEEINKRNSAFSELPSLESLPVL